MKGMRKETSMKAELEARFQDGGQGGRRLEAPPLPPLPSRGSDNFDHATGALPRDALRRKCLQRWGAKLTLRIVRIWTALDLPPGALAAEPTQGRFRSGLILPYPSDLRPPTSSSSSNPSRPIPG